jgi:hypothetical protein
LAYLVVAAAAARHSEGLRALDTELQGMVPEEELQGVVIAAVEQLQCTEVAEEVLAEEELVLAVELQAVTTRRLVDKMMVQVMPLLVCSILCVRKTKLFLQKRVMPLFVCSILCVSLCMQNRIKPPFVCSILCGQKLFMPLFLTWSNSTVFFCSC